MFGVFTFHNFVCCCNCIRNKCIFFIIFNCKAKIKNEKKYSILPFSVLITYIKSKQEPQFQVHTNYNSRST